MTPTSHIKIYIPTKFDVMLQPVVAEGGNTWNAKKYYILTQNGPNCNLHASSGNIDGVVSSKPAINNLTTF